MPHDEIRLGVYTRVDPTEASDVVDSVLQIVDDHYPEPMANMKPTEKNPTAVDKFDKHQSEYESREKSKDRIKEVHEHNSGYPRLRDELDKRRSCTRVRTENKKHSGKISHRSRHIKNPRRKTKLRSRIVKNKRRDKKTNLRRAFVYSREKPYVCDNCGRRYLSKEFIRRCASRPESTASGELVHRTSHHSAGTMSNMSRRYPEPSEPSVSSYQTFYSSDHEPME